MPAKPLLWVGAALDELRQFPEDARRIAGHQLHLLQLGIAPEDWKPMASVGPGVYELRIHTELEHRVFYVAKFVEGIYVLHAFEKRTQKTAQRDIDRGRENLKAALAHRRDLARERKRDR